MSTHYLRCGSLHAKGRTIGGPLRYDLLAQLHRPTDPIALRNEVRRLARSQHLSSRDISVALRLGLPAVEEMLRDSHEG